MGVRRGDGHGLLLDIYSSYEIAETWHLQRLITFVIPNNRGPQEAGLR